MKQTIIEISQNAWEYTGTARILHKGDLDRIDNLTILVDGVLIEFDEEIRIGSTVDGN